jgi:hypothetical protein
MSGFMKDQQVLEQVLLSLSLSLSLSHTKDKDIYNSQFVEDSSILGFDGCVTR